MEEKIIPKKIGSYIIRDKLGHGSFSSVYLALDTNTDLPVAIKAIPKENNDLEKIRRETELLQLLDHPFCVAYFESIEDANYFYIVQEYVEGKTVFDLINSYGCLPEWLCRHIFCQLICALEYLHVEKNVVHRDLKAENIILDINKNIRIIDFGFSNQFTKDDNLLQTACGSPAYAPPEMFTGKHYTSAADLWSAGVVLYAMAVGKLPFQDPNMKLLVRKIVYAEPEYPETMSPDLVDLLKRMLMKDSACRMSIQKIQSHPWFLQYQFASMMNSKFGENQGLRIVCETCGADINVLNRLEDLGYDGFEMYEKAKRNEFSSDVVPFRIVHRHHITCRMRGLYEAAEQADKIRNRSRSPSSQGNQVLSNPPTALRSFAGRRTSQARHNVFFSFTKGERNMGMPGSTPLAGSKESPESRSAKQASPVYRTAALNTFASFNPSGQRRTTTKRYSFGAQGITDP